MKLEENTLLRSKRTIVIGALVALALAAPAVTQASVIGNGVCDGGQLCLYQHGWGGGFIADFYGDDNNYSDNQYAGNPSMGINDKTSSIRNNTLDKCWEVFNNYNQQGAGRVWVPKNTFINVPDFNHGNLLNDEASSHRWHWC